MRPIVTIRRASVAAAALALAALPAAAGAASTWSVAHPPYTMVDNVPYAPLEGIAAISASNVWAVGQDSGTPQINHWNGSSWSQSALPNGPCSVFEADCELFGVSGSSASDVITVGEGTIPTASGWVTEVLAYRWNGSAWSQLTVPSSFTYDEMEHIQTFSPTDAWAVGGTNCGYPTQTVAYHWNGSSWTQVPTPTPGGTAFFNGVAATSARERTVTRSGDMWFQCSAPASTAGSRSLATWQRAR